MNITMDSNITEFIRQEHDKKKEEIERFVFNCILNLKKKFNNKNNLFNFSEPLESFEIEIKSFQLCAIDNLNEMKKIKKMIPIWVIISIFSGIFLTSFFFLIKFNLFNIKNLFNDLKGKILRKIRHRDSVVELI